MTYTREDFNHASEGLWLIHLMAGLHPVATKFSLATGEYAYQIRIERDACDSYRIWSDGTRDKIEKRKKRRKNAR